MCSLIVILENIPKVEIQWPSGISTWNFNINPTDECLPNSQSPKLSRCLPIWHQNSPVSCSVPYMWFYEYYALRRSVPPSSLSSWNSEDRPRLWPGSQVLQGQTPHKRLLCHISSRNFCGGACVYLHLCAWI